MFIYICIRHASRGVEPEAFDCVRQVEVQFPFEEMKYFINWFLLSVVLRKSATLSSATQQCKASIRVYEESILYND